MASIENTSPVRMDLQINKANIRKVGGIKSIVKTDTYFMIIYETGEQAKLNILNSHVFKYFMSPDGEFPDYPDPHNPEDTAKINSKKVTDYDKSAFDKSNLEESDKSYTVKTQKIHIILDKITGTMTVFDKRTNKEVLRELEPLSYTDHKSTQTLRQYPDEYFFGGGMQNGRFTHKGEVINIVNTNNWVDGGVTSPCPFYWSTCGYGVLRNTWQSGVYDFGSASLPDIVTTIHKGERFDAFFFINPLPKDILKDYYELTGQPLFMPEYAFYQAHLNAFNRDYWVEVTADTAGAILFEDGKYYKSYQPSQMGDKKGVLESLNGENNNYQFSARAMIDRYKKHDLPLAWFVPNDGYGSGYGQTDSLAGDIQNLKEFADYARDNGVDVALWTESQLEPNDPDNPKKGERDLSKEVSEAGVVALKCDVAWIGHGYSFGLSAVENAANIFVKATQHGGRTMIIMVDGWAGTQRYSGIWSGDQYGGEWEYIRFHIPTYIGSGLSGQPVIGSDMDGIFGGKSRDVNIRDFQWKTFTPLQLNMDGWGWIPKTPFSFDEEATAINRAYLKLKSMMMPYNYTIGYESIHGLPMIRGMFLEFPNEVTAYTKDSQYQFMWGPSILVAPIYNSKGVLDASLRNGIYLPDPNQVWIDFFTGEKYQGGKILNNIQTPLWKIPVFIKDGAIVPMTNPNNNPYEIKRDNRIFTLYPNGKTSFDVYEDDGKSSDYLEGHFATTKITVAGPLSNKHGDLFVNISKSEGTYKDMVRERTTILQIMASKDVGHIKAALNGETVTLSKVETEDDFNLNENIYYFNKDFMINPYLNKLGGEVWKQKCLLIKFQKTDVTSSEFHLKIQDYTNESKISGGNNNVNKCLKPPSYLTALTQVNVTLLWQPVDDAVYYEIERDGVIFSNITGTAFAFDDFKYESVHRFRIRSVNNGVSAWSNFVTAVERQDPFKSTVKGVKVTCSAPCQPGQAICKLTDGDLSSMWHTNWDRPHQANPKTGQTIKLNFDLGDVYEIHKMEYFPRTDCGNGSILKIQYRYSVDGKNWSPISDPIIWKRDDKVKKVELSGTKMRFVEWHVLESVTGFGSGRQVLFYKSPSVTEEIDPYKNTVKGIKVSCNIPCQPGQDVCKITDGDTQSVNMWHTKWLRPVQAGTDEVIQLNFDLGQIHEIEKMEYYPRSDANNGTFLKVIYRHSVDGEVWSEFSDKIIWNRDENLKTIHLNGTIFRFMELYVVESVGGFGSGRQMLFYKKVK